MADFSTHILSKNPFAYWRLGEKSGTTAVEAVNGHDGTIPGSGVSLGITGAVTRDSNTAMSFDGTGRIVTTTLGSFGSNISGTGHVFTLAFWIKAPNENLGRYAFASLSSGNPGFAVITNGRGPGDTSNHEGDMHFRLSDTDGTVHGEFISPALSPDTWHHVAVNYSLGSSGDRIHRAWVDGVQQDRFANDFNDTSGFGDLSDAFTIGGLNGGSDTEDWFKGDLDEVALFDYALTEQEIQTLYEVGALGIAALFGGSPAILW